VSWGGAGRCCEDKETGLENDLRACIGVEVEGGW
jgi:hypothetical protein